MNDLTYWVWLVKVFGAADPRLWQLGESYNSVETYVYALQSDLIYGITDKESERIKSITLESAEKAISDCAENGIDIYCYESEGYPSGLRKIANPPAVLFCRGNLDFLNNGITAAVVGTRKPSEYSVQITDMLCKELCKRGCSVATGLAEGIDQSANLAVIRNGGYTLGVCGKEIDSDYPAGSEQLKKDIAAHGAVISETCSFLDSPVPAFTQRNRILVGASDALVFVECSLDSMGLDNADHAISQGKQIFAVPPHDIRDKRYSGQTELLRRGCRPLFSAGDIVYNVSSSRLESVSFERSKETSAEDMAVFSGEEETGRKRRKKRSAKKKKDSAEKENVREAKAGSPRPEGVQGEVFCILSEKPMLADEIAEAVDMDISQALALLTDMELDGLIVSLPGKMFGINHN